MENKIAETPMILDAKNIKYYVSTYYDSQKFRIRAGNRLKKCYPKDEDGITSRLDKLEKYNPEKEWRGRRKDLISEARNGISDKMTQKELENYLEQFAKKLDVEKSAIENPQIFNDEFAQASAKMITDYKKVEKFMADRIENQSLRYPKINHALRNIQGIGPTFAGGLISYVATQRKKVNGKTLVGIECFPKVTGLWAYAGLGVYDMCKICGKRYIHDGSRGAWIQNTAQKLIDVQYDQATGKLRLKDKSKKLTPEMALEKAEGYICHCEKPVLKPTSQRRIAGQLIDYNPGFKDLCYLIGEQFVKQSESPYRKLYEQYYLEYSTLPDLAKERDEKKKDPVDGKMGSKGTAHIYNMSRRRAVKMFIAHMWQVWRELEGLPTPDPYGFGHDHVDKIEPFQEWYNIE
jgi:hypothetical protein